MVSSLIELHIVLDGPVLVLLVLEATLLWIQFYLQGRHKLVGNSCLTESALFFKHDTIMYPIA